MDGQANGVESKHYTSLKEFRLETEVQDETFVFCSWVYLLKSTTFPCTLIGQVESESTRSSPLLLLTEKRRLMLFPLHHYQNEAHDSSNLTTSMEIQHASTESEFPLDKWVHVGCEVSNDCLRLHLNGKLVEEKPLSSLIDKDPNLSIQKIILVGTVGANSGNKGYLYNSKVLVPGITIEDHYKDSPMHLTIDNSSASDIEEGSDGVWSIVGGKASCRRNFSLDVVLLDAFGQTVHKELEVVASLVYADNGALVERSGDAEAPLLTSYDGIEFDSHSKPSKLLQGRASFKLKISQLSSKCDSRLFRIRFNIPKGGNFPFLEALSSPVRCISRHRNARAPPVIIWKRPPSGIPLGNGYQASKVFDKSLEIRNHIVREAKPSPSSKRVRLGKDEFIFEQPDDECNSHLQTADQAKVFFGASPVFQPKDSEMVDNSPSDSESVGVRNVNHQNMASTGNTVSDASIFKYCLGSLMERSLLLKEIAAFASDEELLEFASQVALYTGCSHHWRQVTVAKRLIEEGTKLWNLISQDNCPVRWETAVFEIELHFTKIASCNSRSLLQQDLECLRRIAGCQDYLTQENFEKLWCWLYPVAFTLSMNAVKPIWMSMEPKWIEGFITKEEAELSLQSSRGLQEPGTFILHFPTSRSWPHPDAGSLVVSYVGCDYSIHHRLLSLDHLHRCNSHEERNIRPLHEMLLAEPELSQLGRVSRAR